ncbi:putative hydro-lyase [Sulfurospirillum arcachonense]|uniref:putative hydro-lyase n=1 Tax=Sulfurospirillum arcachonense TaxID=57666 RepID=UPI00046AD790|nr:putative hydro-lyase [Sulfurospirillum arcachonense]
MTVKEFREKIAKGEFDKPTAGYCSGHVQANMVVLPKEYADSFEEFAKKNSKAIPVLEVVKGSHFSQTLAKGANLLNELPSYDIIENGEKVKSVKSIEEYYKDDFVFFLIGCSFTFETSLLQNGISLRHVDLKTNVTMYDTNIELEPVDMFKGNMVVSMRPIKKERVADACVVTSHFPNMHGTPIQVGYPEMIGIKDVQNPDYGDAVEIKDDEIPLFWPCGVTPQNVLREVKLPFAITHSPGHMFVSDKKDSDYYV